MSREYHFQVEGDGVDLRSNIVNMDSHIKAAKHTIVVWFNCKICGYSYQGVKRNNKPLCPVCKKAKMVIR